MSRPFPYVQGVEHRFVEANGLRMHVAEAGEGDPLVLVHGWPQHWYQWRRQIPVLAEHYRVICPDMRGFGWSDAPPGAYDKETLAADIIHLLDALELERVRLMAHDWGGWCGFINCLRHPERFERFLALNIPPPWSQLDARAIAAFWRFWYQALIATPLVGYTVIRRVPQFVGMLLQGTTQRPGVWSEQEMAEFIEPLREPARARATVKLYRTFLTRELPKLARGKYESLRLTTPTLLLFGEEDFAISPSLLRGYEPYVDDMTLQRVPGVGHFIGEEAPEVVNEAALAFFGDEQPRHADTRPDKVTPAGENA